jgi:excisionase family DNA binding protein
MNLEGYLTVAEFAKLKGVTVQAVYQKLNRGNLKSVKIGSITLVKE